MKLSLLTAASIAFFGLLARGAGPGTGDASRPAAGAASAVIGTRKAQPDGGPLKEWPTIREAHEALRHQVQAVAGEHQAWEAHNPGQQWRTQFDGRGFLTTPHAEEWRWGLELAEYGFAGNRTVIAPGRAAEVRTEGGRVSYRWDGILEEWYVNDSRGLEHGFVLQERPAGGTAAQPLEVVLAVRGGLRPDVTAGGQAVQFYNQAGAAVVNYGGLKVWDAQGTVLPSRFVPGPGGGLVLQVEEAAARYPLTIDPLAQQAYLKAFNADARDHFGTAVALSGDTAVIGAPGEDSRAQVINGEWADNSAPGSGAAYVFVRSATGWTQQAYLKASNSAAGHGFGGAVAISGDTIIVGARFEDSSAIGVNGAGGARVAYAGSAYIFVRNGTEWTQQAYLKASNTGARDFFGASVDISGDTVVVGAPGEASRATVIDGDGTDNSTPGAGAAYVFVRRGTEWSQQAYLKPSATGRDNQFGYSVAISGETVVAGAPGAPRPTPSEVYFTSEQPGAAYIFERRGTLWMQQAFLMGRNSEVAGFGYAVAVSGDTLAVGAPYSFGIGNGASGEGAVYIFVSSSGVWSEQAVLYEQSATPGSKMGGAVALWEDTLVVGSPEEMSSSFWVNGASWDTFWSFAGSVDVYVRSGTRWNFQAYLKPNNTGQGDFFGGAVAVSGGTVVVGACQEDSGAAGIDGNGLDNSGPDSGAAYVFTDYGPALPALEVWRLIYFKTREKSGIAADDADPDGDGRVNLVEWATGTHPRQADDYRWSLRRNGERLEFTFQAFTPAQAAGYWCTVEWSETLAPGSWQEGENLNIGFTQGDLKTYTYSIPVTGPRAYMRLRVKRL